MNTIYQKNTASKEKTQQIVRLRKTKELLETELLLDSAISSLKPDAFSKLNKNTKRVLDYLLTCKHPLIWQSQKTIAKNIGNISREHVNKALHRLRELGIIDWFQRYNDSNVYRLHDIVYTYQFRQTYKHLFEGLNHPSFYALIPSWLRPFTKKVTLILKNYFYIKNNNYKERQLFWQSCSQRKENSNKITIALYRALYSEPKTPRKEPFLVKKRIKHNYFPNPISAAPLPHVLVGIVDSELRKVMQEYFERCNQVQKVTA